VAEDPRGRLELRLLLSNPTSTSSAAALALGSMIPPGPSSPPPPLDHRAPGRRQRAGRCPGGPPLVARGLRL